MIKTIAAIVFIVFMLATLAAGIYFYLRDKSLNDIRADVYQLFLQAEHNFTNSGSGKFKMRWVINRVRDLLPVWLQAVITEELLYKVVEGWFRAVKDLLDDGKLNHSGKENNKNEN